MTASHSDAKMADAKMADAKMTDAKMPIKNRLKAQNSVLSLWAALPLPFRRLIILSKHMMFALFIVSLRKNLAVA